jgi:alpha-tubulin suppressor-like RCC1 family protein
VCPSGERLCGGACVNTLTDGSHCGGCGRACPATQRCEAGACACAGALTACGAACVATATDTAHCGACGAACPPRANSAPTCRASRCVVDCASGYGDCDGAEANGCEANLRTASTACGMCGRACATGEVCNDGVCGPPPCPSGQIRCAGACRPGGGVCTAGIGACAAAGTIACGDAAALSITTGLLSTCALLTDRTVRCWGSRAVGSPVGTRVPVLIPDIADAVQLSLGGGSACARLRNGTLRCWGDNARGQLGNGNTTTSYTPVTVAGISTAVSVDVGGAHACALLADRTVRCWGSNDGGEITGTASATPFLTPYAIPGLTGVTQISVGEEHACALVLDGTVRCWGRNNDLRLGAGGSLVTPPGVRDVVEVSSGGLHNCARIRDGRVQCWGSNAFGELGVAGTAGPVFVPGLAGVTALATTTWITCALVADGGVRCWGDGRDGERGDGTTATGPGLSVVTGVTGATQISGSFEHFCVRLSDGTARCWGSNSSAQLGDGTFTTPRTSPVVVQSLSGGARCDAPMGAPAAETCNGLDDDCNGVIDDVAPGTTCA